MLTATRLAYADPDAVTGGWDIHVQSTLPPRDLRADLTPAASCRPMHLPPSAPRRRC